MRTFRLCTRSSAASISFGALQRSFVPYAGGDVESAGARIERAAWT
ncbi:hypothetical protein [Streptomyces sp. bgisy031]